MKFFFKKEREKGERKIKSYRGERKRDKERERKAILMGKREREKKR